MREVYLHSWENVENPKGVVQIFHGMAEHAARYDEFARYLNNCGYIVFADDHRGHGRTAGTVDEVGYMGADGFYKIVEDERSVSLEIKSKYPGLPIIIAGHSFGSFIAQEYITRYGNDIAGVIMSGVSMNDKADVIKGMVIAWVQKTFLGGRRKSKLIDKMVFGECNKRVINPASSFSWLTRDADIVKKYDEDPFCGTVFTTSFYYYFLKGLKNLYKEDKLAAIPKKLPVFIIGGTEDPVSKYGEYVVRIKERYIALGLEDVETKLYPNARHEILNEINRQEVFADIIMWISGHV